MLTQNTVFFGAFSCFLISTQFLSGFPLSGDSTFRGVELVGMSSIDLPSGVLDAIAAPPADREPIIRRELAVSLYREEYRSFGKARELAGRSTSSTLGNDGRFEHVAADSWAEQNREADVRLREIPPNRRHVHALDGRFPVVCSRRAVDRCGGGQSRLVVGGAVRDEVSTRIRWTIRFKSVRVDSPVWESFGIATTATERRPSERRESA
ncbi:UPF0175 family protein [Halorubrum sp. AS12]|uniref:UPF0175 family protein n=1 Tax=Halorubrum sp. AS12 TaxID=3409687 RepID=UPI003DA6EA22